jgi:hypothetical protein
VTQFGIAKTRETVCTDAQRIYESDPQLRKFVEDNYILVDELTLVKGAKPIRFFARREPASQPQ